MYPAPAIKAVAIDSNKAWGKSRNKGVAVKLLNGLMRKNQHKSWVAIMINKLEIRKMRARSLKFIWVKLLSVLSWIELRNISL